MASTDWSAHPCPHRSCGLFDQPGKGNGELGAPSPHDPSPANGAYTDATSVTVTGSVTDVCPAPA